MDFHFAISTPFLYCASDPARIIGGTKIHQLSQRLERLRSGSYRHLLSWDCWEEIINLIPFRSGCGKREAGTRTISRCRPGAGEGTQEKRNEPPATSFDISQRGWIFFSFFFKMSFSLEVVVKEKRNFLTSSRADVILFAQIRDPQEQQPILQQEDDVTYILTRILFFFCISFY